VKLALERIICRFSGKDKENSGKRSSAKELKKKGIENNRGLKKFNRLSFSLIFEETL
jgi:hypothetical protein